MSDAHTGTVMRIYLRMAVGTCSRFYRTAAAFRAVRRAAHHSKGTCDGDGAGNIRIRIGDHVQETAAAGREHLPDTDSRHAVRKSGMGNHACPACSCDR